MITHITEAKIIVFS